MRLEVGRYQRDLKDLKAANKSIQKELKEKKTALQELKGKQAKLQHELEEKQTKVQALEVELQQGKINLKNLENNLWCLLPAGVLMSIFFSSKFKL